uniref:Uncharacterized protein n=1 Tax=Plectus sambesii TaxID=2011161 RepID=A0A914X4P0_9BILA
MANQPPNIFNNQNNQGRMVGGPVHGGNIYQGDYHNDARVHHVNIAGGVHGGNNAFAPINGPNAQIGNRGAPANEAGPNQGQEDRECKKAYDGFFKKYLSKDARQKLPGKPYNIKTGKMLIINNEEWPRDLRINGRDVNLNGERNRDGTNIDRDALKELSKIIGFGEAEVKENRTVQQMKEDLNKFATEQDWKNLDAAIVCILSHVDNREAGDGANVGNNEKIEFESAEDLFNSAYPFFADTLPSQELMADSNYKSQAADVLVLWATGWGFLAWRNRSTGSVFIQELIEAIRNNPDELHMIDLMEQVITSVKNRFHAGPADYHHPGECPQFLSSLDRKLYLMQ